MRCLSRNKQVFQYRNYLTGTEIKVGDLNTGVVSVSYSAPVTCTGSISPASGYSETEQFGTLEGYDKVIVTNEMLPIDENSVINIDNLVQSSTEPYDYIVKRVARSLNYTSIAIKKVDVS